MLELTRESLCQNYWFLSRSFWFFFSLRDLNWHPSSLRGILGHLLVGSSPDRFLGKYLGINAYLWEGGDLLIQQPISVAYQWTNFGVRFFLHLS